MRYANVNHIKYVPMMPSTEPASVISLRISREAAASTAHQNITDAGISTQHPFSRRDEAQAEQPKTDNLKPAKHFEERLLFSVTSHQDRHSREHTLPSFVFSSHVSPTGPRTTLNQSPYDSWVPSQSSRTGNPREQILHGASPERDVCTRK